MIIYCDTPEQFYDAVFAMVKRGVMFEANAAELSLKLTGGY